MKKKTKVCGQCFEPFDFVAILGDAPGEQNMQFCSHNCHHAFKKREVIKLDDKSWKTFVKMINEKR